METPGIRIGPASPEDEAAVLALLDRSRLPKDGLTDHLGTTIVARHGDRIVGTAALELYADGALLRSVAVDPEMRGRGIGHRLTDAATRRAAELGVPALYLLTTTAERFFPRFGFSTISRDDVPGTVKASVEFGSACPDSATVMRKMLVTQGLR
jgi:amino-acid N-acetyltransferase